MRGDIQDKLWRQLEAEILLHRHKAVIRACRRGRYGPGPPPAAPFHRTSSASQQNQQGIGETRLVVLAREPDEGLGISITVSILLLKKVFSIHIFLFILKKEMHQNLYYFCLQLILKNNDFFICLLFLLFIPLLEFN
jgi:hypothetical protein